MDRENKTDAGVFKINNEAIKSIAIIAAKEVDGVIGTKQSFMSKILSPVCKCPGAEGVRLKINENDIKITLSIIARYGADLPTVAANVQERVKNEIEKMTGLSNIEVNVNINDIAKEIKI